MCETRRHGAHTRHLRNDHGRAPGDRRIDYYRGGFYADDRRRGHRDVGRPGGPGSDDGCSDSIDVGTHDRGAGDHHASNIVVIDDQSAAHDGGADDHHASNIDVFDDQSAAHDGGADEHDRSTHDDGSTGNFHHRGLVETRWIHPTESSGRQN